MNSLSTYDISIPVLLRGLGILDNYLDKAATFANDSKIDPETLVNARLAPDMLTLAGQIHRASDTSKNAVGRLTGAAVPSFPDTETTLEELKERVSKTVAFLKTVQPQDMKDSATRTVQLKFGPLSATLAGNQFVLQFLLPNFFFHVTTVHDILRHKGVPVGKLDYIGPLQG